MARIKFTGPEGAPYCGKKLRLITLDLAKLEHIDDLQRETGAGMDEVIRWFDPKKKLAKGTAAIFYFTLRNAGMFVTFDEAWRTALAGEYEQVAEPGDKKKGEAPADPHPAPPASGRGSEADTATSSTSGPRKHAKKKSGSPSSRVS